MKNKRSSFITPHEFRLLSLTILLIICGSLGLDIHLASLPHIMHFMHTDKQHMQQSVTLFILGTAVSLLVYGPLSDKVGRKPVIVCGLTVACISSVLLAATNNIALFLFLRLLQGIGSGVCWGIGRIVIADIIQGERLASIGSYFTLFLSLSPMLAPVVGGYMQHWFGWRSNFILLGGIILVVLLSLIFFLDETNRYKNPKALHFESLIRIYLSFFKERLFLGCTLLTGISTSASIVYVTMSSFIFQREFHVGPILFGWLTAIVGVSNIIWRLFCPALIYRLKWYRSLVLGLSVILLSGVLLFSFFFMHYNRYLFLLAISCSTLGIVLVGSITMAMALSPFHDKRGAAGALFGSFQLSISFIISAAAASFPHSGSGVLSASYVILGVLGLSVYFTLVQNFPTQRIEVNNNSSA